MISKIFSIALPIAWFTLLWHIPEVSKLLTLPISFCVGVVIPILWKRESDIELAKQEGVIQERLRDFKQKWGN